MEFDFPRLKRALETSDAASLAGLYAEDAEMTIADRNRPPSTPMRLADASLRARGDRCILARRVRA